MIRVDALWLSVEPLDMRASTETILARRDPAPVFHPAEESHQRYFERNPDQGYCQVVIAPKVAKLRQQFSKIIRKSERN